MRIVAILLAFILSSGSAQARELKLATWNLAWLTLRPAGDPALPPGLVPYDAADLDRLAGYARSLRADVVAIQGVDGVSAAAAVFPPEDWTVVLTADYGTLRSGFAVRRGLVFTQNDDVDALDPDQGRLRPGADITLGAGANRLRVLSVQLKSGCRTLPLEAPNADPACAVLHRQGRAIGGWIDARDGEPFAVLGDFARVLDGAGETSGLLGTATPLLRATAGHGNPCWGGGAFSDHLLLGGRAADWLLPNTLRAMVFRETDNAARAHLPTHCPISIRLLIPS